MEGPRLPPPVSLSGTTARSTSPRCSTAPQRVRPATDFDPSTVGRIVKIAPNGKRTQAQVTMPTGLLSQGGHLYSTAWSVASFLGIPDAGQIVKVKAGAFH